MDGVYLDCSKAFDTISFSVLLENLGARGLDGRSLQWIKDWLDVWAERVVVNGAKPCWSPVTSGVPRDQLWGKSCLTSLVMILTWGLPAT